jgi:SAM-dependent methyltransferase
MSIGKRDLINASRRAQLPITSFDFRGLPIFYEEFIPENHSRFDSELDEITKADALARRTMKGFCNISATETDFDISSENLRENIVARSSLSINRQRVVVCGLSCAIFGCPYASLDEITTYINEKRLKVYSAEANSSFFQHLKQRLRAELFFYSEFFGAEYKSGELVNDISHQDLQHTSFDAESFDIVLTSEVFEHIPDAVAAEREVVRILKKGGIYCFTVPFLPYKEHDLILAELDDAGTIKYLAEPQYHGDPVRPNEGILVYRLFSFNDLKQRFEALACRFLTYRFWSKSLGILDNNGWVHVVEKVST